MGFYSGSIKKSFDKRSVALKSRKGSEGSLSDRRSSSSLKPCKADGGCAGSIFG
eukprot:m.19761 g.19761  ORF g.19761 m.19761 type:complete len:54 (-) comp12600_c0_seq1:480-641(-)